MIQSELSTIQALRKEYERNIPEVYRILKEGSIRAQKVAAQTLADVKAAMKINYFDDEELIQSQAERFGEDK